MFGMTWKHGHSCNKAQKNYKNPVIFHTSLILENFYKGYLDGGLPPMVLANRPNLSSILVFVAPGCFFASFLAR